MKILCAGDLHMGRQSTGLADWVDSRDASTAECWGRIVECALAERVDVVALTGDIVDRSNAYFEAFGPLERGLRQLARAGIDTVAVAGNHDFEVLGRLADAAAGERFRVLGRGGRWESWSLERDGATLAVFVGWSFPESHWRTDPLADFPALPAGEAPVFGLLHTEVDAPASPYAPVSLATLRSAPTAAWLLGHVHRPTRYDEGGGPLVLYPGSPQALDPGERGERGVWIVTWSRSDGVSARMAPLSRVRYDEIEVDVDGVSDTLELERRASVAVRDHLHDVAPEGGVLRHIACRLRLTGRTGLHHALEAPLNRLRSDLEVRHGEASASVERVVLATRPAADLGVLARGRGPVAALARLIRALEVGADGGEASGGRAQPEELSGLLSAAERAVSGVAGARPYMALGGGDPGATDPADEVRRRVHRQAVLLLDALLAQKERAS